MEAIYKIKNNKELELFVDKVKEHLGETINKDFITIDEIVALAIEFAYAIEEKEDEIRHLNNDIEEYYIRKKPEDLI